MKKPRFNQPMYSTTHFSESILAKCPKCNGLCFIKTKLGRYPIFCPEDNKSTLHCQTCGYTKVNNEEWFGYSQGILKMHCGFCGSKLQHTTKPTKKPFETISIKCQICNQEKIYPLNWYRYKGNEPIDPYFGLELWLQITIKDNILWVYNNEHLKYLKEYVASELREDNTRYKYSIVSNLPKWVKLAKNRGLIIKKLNMLEAKLA